MFLLLAALPALFWEGAADTAPTLREAHISKIVVPPANLASWKNTDGIAAEAGDLQGALKLLAPSVSYRMDEASATRAPWLVSNGWKYIRRPQGSFYYDVTGKQAALAAAEAFSFSSSALIRTDAAGLKPLAEMLEFLKSVQADPLPAVADIGYIDDGSSTSGEVMNLLGRNNLLFRLVTAPDPKLKINVKLGTKEYPLEDAKNPGKISQEVRANLTDLKRSVRVYGSPVVVARLYASDGRARLHLINYAGAARKVDGIRIRVLGQYSKHQLHLVDGAGVELQDFTADADATEFTLPELKMYAVIDLTK